MLSYRIFANNIADWIKLKLKGIFLNTYVCTLYLLFRLSEVAKSYNFWLLSCICSYMMRKLKSFAQQRQRKEEDVLQI